MEKQKDKLTLMSVDMILQAYKSETNFRIKTLENKMNTLQMLFEEYIRNLEEKTQCNLVKDTTYKLTVDDKEQIITDFRINGINAASEDFGTMERDDGAIKYFGHAVYTFTPRLPTVEILLKYNMNLKAYKRICDELMFHFKVKDVEICNRSDLDEDEDY